MGAVCAGAGPGAQHTASAMAQAIMPRRKAQPCATDMCTPDQAAAMPARNIRAPPFRRKA
jgi:hypothetical protein